jgi:polar amino acid transport system ATP-binding protein
MNNNNKSDDILVKFSDVTKQYGDLIVLDKLNLEIKKNEMVSIIGHLDQEKQQC